MTAAYPPPGRRYFGCYSAVPPGDGLQRQRPREKSVTVMAKRPRSVSGVNDSEFRFRESLPAC